MNKRLTDETREAWGLNLYLLKASCGNAEVTADSDDLCALIESEKAGWEEVERLKEKFYTEQERAEKFIHEAYKQIKEVERLKEENERIFERLEHLANKPIAVFGEGFGYEEHYRWLKDDLKSLVASIQRIQRGE
ncbi:hypothetical protein M5X00_31250 [Paenibacillus alvei]|uniref:Ead/Ea22-like family protein n=1 Tax=Paenibacillus alvei TaxID=44250 RepID=A0ABT4H0Z4_PAEAL|nr:hypothetical protein [Paenibacillus alvei]EJW14246.1 hypothetical protein PAV_15c00350 [Paenibacillus alvei DSM 29]MCY9708509.1 hypothetical protein [Paenibacillus alvei]MCY9737988.1 hypothetical protein [Paenibacillus alvei]MCY9758698.1 hypothetical protein [Paenibacillus alvei]MCY9762618.1 hypothetical protein [Paenibacillus alvei]